MYINKIVLSNFKNIKEAELEFSSKVNCISGNNGEGKTNLLDAIYYLSMSKSYFQSSDQFTYMHGTDETALHGFYTNEDNTEDHIALILRKSSDKIVKKNDKVYSRISEHIGRFPIVMVSPYDTSLINDSGEERRRFLNMILSQVDKEYLRKLQIYNQILLQRNKFLKATNVSDDYLDTLSEQLDVNARYIYARRKELCARLEDLVIEYYRIISGEIESVSIQYRSDLDKADLIDLLDREREKDKFLKYTSVGIHRDELLLSLSGYSIKKCGSQGQQKSFLIALKMAQFAIMKELYNGKPAILLLDDLFDKLDMRRIEKLLKMVAGDFFGQIFITDSNKIRMEKVVNSITQDHSSFVMENGICKRVE